MNGNNNPPLIAPIPVHPAAAGPGPVVRPQNPLGAQLNAIPIPPPAPPPQAPPLVQQVAAAARSCCTIL